MKKLSISKQMNGNAIPKITRGGYFFCLLASKQLHREDWTTFWGKSSSGETSARRAQICGIHPNEWCAAEADLPRLRDAL